MAFIKCPKCKEIISNLEENCPNCGYVFPKHHRGCFYAFIITAVFILFVYILSSIGLSKKSTNTESDNENNRGTNIINDNKTYTKSWREPYDGSETVAITRIMVKNNITGCGIYYVKVVTPGEYVLACTSDTVNWTYYVVYTNLGKIYLANDEMVSKLKPPDL